ncbi:hypothetical protein JOF53_008429 [Crossiella equi]|uniref:Acyltransferase n=1 Tax=Crossiella equi TaxID=130796 RepID=A0ABS5ASJ5_9PSEU|nr:acyltransferase domain-containing protein [Crossiella equi]MBP2479557.1 hypothetical protein [Crossiella equi]
MTALQDVVGFTAELPGALHLPEVLLDLAVPHEDVNELLRHRDALAEPALRALLGRAAGAVLREQGTPGQGLAPPVFPAETGSLGRCFPAFVFLAALPHTRSRHRELGVPEHVSRHSLADLGRQLAVHRRRTGTTGLSHPGWLTRHFRAELYQLGRLQFELRLVDADTAASLRLAGAPVTEGQVVLSVHIPDFLGPFTPEACEDSFTRARAFFPEHFPGGTADLLICESWLLDPQLREYLPAHANIVSFQDRFAVVRAEEEPGDDTVVDFVFGSTEVPRHLLPRRTGLQRAVLDHLAAGGHWYPGLGWAPLG